MQVQATEGRPVGPAKVCFHNGQCFRSGGLCMRAGHLFGECDDTLRNGGVFTGCGRTCDTVFGGRAGYQQQPSFQLCGAGVCVSTRAV